MEITDKMAGKPQLLRYQLFLAYVFAFLAIWYGALNYIDHLLSDSGKEDQTSENTKSNFNDLRQVVAWNVIVFAPLWGILVLGLYALISVIHGVAIMSDCPDAADEVDRDVKGARLGLMKKGIEVGS